MAHVATVTLPATASALTDFPTLLTPDSDAGWDTFWSTVVNGGGDVRVFLDDDTTELAREIVSCDTGTETGEIWVKVPSTSATLTTDIHIHADGSSTEPAVTATYGRNAVWSDYTVVLHLQEDPSDSAPQFKDSTGNGFDGTAVGTLANVAGAFGANAIDFTGGTSGDDITFAQPIHTVSNFTISYWVQIHQTDDYIAGSWSTTISDRRWFTRFETNDLFVRSSDGSYNGTVTSMGALTVNQWGYSVFGSDTDVLKGSTDAETLVSGSTGPWIPNVPKTWHIGLPRPSWPELAGYVDEFRVSTSAPSQDLIDTERANQNSPATWYSVAAAGGGGAFAAELTTRALGTLSAAALTVLAGHSAALTARAIPPVTGQDLTMFSATELDLEVNALDPLVPLDVSVFQAYRAVLTAAPVQPLVAQPVDITDDGFVASLTAAAIKSTAGQALTTFSAYVVELTTRTLTWTPHRLTITGEAGRTLLASMTRTLTRALKRALLVTTADD